MLILSLSVSSLDEWGIYFSSLPVGGQAKTLMFVQLNPDTQSFSETLSTLKFAERVSGVELGAAKSNKEGRYVRELMEQVLIYLSKHVYYIIPSGLWNIF